MVLRRRAARRVCRDGGGSAVFFAAIASDTGAGGEIRNGVEQRGHLNIVPGFGVADTRSDILHLGHATMRFAAGDSPGDSLGAPGELFVADGGGIGGIAGFVTTPDVGGAGSFGAELAGAASGNCFLHFEH
jgi:hypothetical protein